MRSFASLRMTNSPATFIFNPTRGIETWHARCKSSSKLGFRSLAQALTSSNLGCTRCKSSSKLGFRSLAQALTSSNLGCTRCKSSSKLGFRSLAQAFIFHLSTVLFRADTPVPPLRRCSLLGTHKGCPYGSQFSSFIFHFSTFHLTITLCVALQQVSPTVRGTWLPYDVRHCSPGQIESPAKPGR